VLSLAGDGFGGDVAAVAVGMGGGNWLLVELGEEDMGDGVMDGVGCGLEEIGEADVETAFAQADGGVEGGEAAEANVEWWDGSAGTELTVLLLEDGYKGGWGDGLGFCGAGFAWRVRTNRPWGWR